MQAEKRSKPQGREARAFPRVALPMSVHIGEHRYAAGDWSVHGFGLAEPVPDLGKGEVSRATLELRGAGIDVRVPLACEVIRATTAGAVGFRIVDLAPRQAEVLHRIVDDYLAGQAPALEQLLFRDVAEIAAERVQRRWFSFGRVLAQLLVIAALLAAAGFGVLANLLTVEAHYGAVTAPAMQLASPATGILLGEERLPGQAVARGDVLYRIAAPEAAQRQGELTARRAQLDVLKSQQMDRLLEIQSVSSELEASLEQQMTALSQRIAALDQRVALDRRELARAEDLARRGHVAQSVLDRRAGVVAEMQQQRAELEQERAVLSADLKLAREGVYRSDLRDNVPTTQVMLRRIDETEAQIAGIDRELAQLGEAANVRSPCDCDIHAVGVRVGEQVKQGDLLLQLRERGDVAVDALILGEQARALMIGGRGTVSLADGSERAGRIADIVYDNVDPLRVGLPDRLFAAERYARVRLTVDDLASDQVGMTAAVSFRHGWVDRLLAAVGL